MEDSGVITRWELRRNCVLTPHQLLASFGGVTALQSLVGAAFWWMGYPGVAAWMIVEWAAIATALLAYMPSACDRDDLVLHRGAEGVRLLVEQHHGAQVLRTGFDPVWVRVSLDAGDPAALVTLSAGGRQVQVGRHARLAERQRVATELRQALSGAASW